MKKKTVKAGRPGIGHLLLLLPLVAVAIWVVDRGRSVRVDPGAVLDALRSSQGPTLPEPEAAGAASRTPVEAFDRETLYEYIDGAADAFLARGFERCVVADYAFAAGDDPDIELVAEVYRFASEAGAQEQNTADLPATAEPAADLPGAHHDDEVLLMVAGRDLLKVIVLSPAPQAPQAMLSLARAWRQEPSR